MARLERLRIYPVKGLDGADVETVEIRPGGTLAGDRRYALLDGEETINAKDSERFHRLDTDFDPATDELVVDPPEGDRETFDLSTGSDRERAADWFGDYFGLNLSLARDTEVGFVDRPSMGPSVISTATLETVASWFEDLTVESARRRLRANVEVSGVPAFWEDRFLGDDAPAFEAGGVRFEGVTPCGRCVVPQRDPDTGEPLEGFKQRFVRKREETFPEWADRDAFDHSYSLMLISDVPEAYRGETLSVGEDVTVVER